VELRAQPAQHPAGQGFACRSGPRLSSLAGRRRASDLRSSQGPLAGSRSFECLSAHRYLGARDLASAGAPWQRFRNTAFAAFALIWLVTFLFIYEGALVESWLLPGASLKQHSPLLDLLLLSVTAAGAAAGAAPVAVAIGVVSVAFFAVSSRMERLQPEAYVPMGLAMSGL
jgi:hypothetical protein